MSCNYQLERFFVDDLGELAKNQDQIKIFYAAVENLRIVTLNHLDSILLKHSDLLKGKRPYFLLSI